MPLRSVVHGHPPLASFRINAFSTSRSLWHSLLAVRVGTSDQTCVHFIFFQISDRAQSMKKDLVWFLVKKGCPRPTSWYGANRITLRHNSGAPNAPRQLETNVVRWRQNLGSTRTGRMRRSWIVGATFAIGAIVAPHIAADAVSSTYSIVRARTDGGGGTSAALPFQLHNAVGQVSVGHGEASLYRLNIGFLSAVPATEPPSTTPPSPPLPGPTSPAPTVPTAPSVLVYVPATALHATSSYAW